MLVIVVSIRYVVMSEERACPICNRRFVASDGDVSSRPFVVYPNNICVHIQCADPTLRVCPVSGVKFGQQQQSTLK